MDQLPIPRSIQLLSSELTDQIAAGEVVERPASVVKELVENALDAGATRISVEIERGGQGLIRITDNGSGIAADELPLALTRHATSKIATFHDLLNVASFGFRGEALASVGSVSRLRLVSRAERHEAAAIAAEHGRLGEVEPAALASGTIIEVRDLFANVPARLKFLKSLGTEAKRCQDAVSRMALSRLDVGFVFKAEGRTLFRFPPDQPLSSRLAAFWPPAICEGLLPFDRARDGRRIHGLAGSPQKAQGRADRMLFFVNGRAVQDRVLSSAAREAYKGRLLAREYPQVVAFLELPPEEVDVNVHPAKMEVRFREEQSVFLLVRQTLQDALEATGPALYADAGRAPGEAGTAAAPPPRWRPAPTPAQLGLVQPRSSRAYGDSQAEDDTFFPQPKFPAYREYTRQVAEEPSAEAPSRPFSDAGREPSAATQEARPPSIGDMRYLGQIADTYLLLGLPDGTLGILDQHAAHERILYAAMHRRGRSGQSMPLALPVEMHLHEAQAEKLAELGDELAALGFGLERPSHGLVRITSTPSSLTAGAARDYIEAALDGQATSLEDLWVLMSCKTALKAGQPLAQDEALRLIEAWRAVPDRYYCPHGRPALVRLGAGELERLFKRR
ncbi:DNA mismatch repair protein mutL [Desulfovibrio sp. X2]|uniref:DNA mismatch repair endonuclease MutL n=1 Tax=Desulfovibrio sp. X2 TaxID=941449 RepID=UPI000358B8BF|nr:DNA mismatch repair endonuclease MutL [Desulfovibrio sp. X2]EPR42455.1 DNA mismatch repair protein mutL [Desulfovibrio sp. X2]